MLSLKNERIITEEYLVYHLRTKFKKIFIIKNVKLFKHAVYVI